MKPRIRYTLVAAGIIAFIVFAPLIVLFVSGTRYDFASQRFVKTGIIAAKADPRSVSVLLNGKEVDTTPATIRFVIPDDYVITLHKDGYFDWTKRLAVRSQYVTWLNENLPAITMFYSEPKKTEIAPNGVLDFYADDGHLVYVTASNIHFETLSFLKTTHDLAFPKNLTAPKIMPSNTGDYYLIQDGAYNAVYDSGQNKLWDISSFASSTAVFAFYQGNDLYELDKGSLYHIFWEQKKRDPIAEKVLAYTVSNNILYYITGNSLMSQELYGGNQTSLFNNLPGFSKAQILLSNQNQVFILGDQTLYVLGGSLTPIADFVTTAKIFGSDHKVMFATGNEVSAYDIDTTSNFLITRSTKAIANPVPDFTLGWTMFLNDGLLQIIETDNRDHQNNYTFAKVSEGAKFYANSSFENVYLLDSGKLEKLVIR